MVRESHFELGDDLRRYEALLQMADLVVHRRGLPDLLPELAERLHRVASFEVANFSLYDPARNLMRMHSGKATSFFPIWPNYRWKKQPAAWHWRNKNR